MSQELPKAYDPSLIEEKWSKFWVDERIFDVPTPAATDAIKPFVQLLPPPNVTGRLHMGHMLNQTEMDILTRWHRMSADTAVWVPGTDHAGIATQMMVERQLAAEGTTTRQDLGREAFTERVWTWKQQYGSAITDQMRRLGASVAWSREYFTMDDRLSRAVREAFVRLWEQGLIYRGAYIVNWDPVLLTAVSDLEVESEERAGYIYHISYNLADGSGSIVVATTRPETMLGDVAVAVNPNDERYKHLVGKKLILPLSAAAGSPDREIPILADNWANPEFGTGAVKVTPAHDPNDFAIGQRHNLPSPSIMDERARISLEGSPYHGLDRFEARKQIVNDLRDSGVLVDIKDHALTLPISQRTGAVIEPRLSMQWFLAVNKTPCKLAPLDCHSERSEGPASTGAPQQPTPAQNSIAANAIAAVREGHIKFTPEMYTKAYNEWMNNIHDWCLSRQLWWGHRIPAWHCGKCGEINVAREAPAACSKCASTDLTQETDVLDTWFSSGLLPFTAFGWPGDANPVAQKKPVLLSEQQKPVILSEQRKSVILSEAEARLFRGSAQSKDPGDASPTETADTFSTLTPDLAAFYPTQLLVTGFDILFFWVARMIMLGCHFMLDVPMPNGAGGLRPRTLAEAVPFQAVYIHALVRDADRQKMSKTKGNVIDPIEIVTKYGTDAVRFTLASQASPGTDIAFNEARTEGYRAFANKIWNAARFIQMNIDRAREAGYTVTLPGNGTANASVILSEERSDENRSVILSEERSDENRSVILSEERSDENRSVILSEERSDENRSVILSEERSDESKDPDSPSPAHAADTFSTTTPLETRWILSRLSTVSAEVHKSLAAYRFDEAANAVYQFFWGEFCDWYLELVKLRLNFGPPSTDGSSRPEPSQPHREGVAERPAVDPATNTTELTLNALVSTFEAALRLLSPFMPFLTEELWHALYASIGIASPSKSIALTRYPQAADFAADPASVTTMNFLQEFITLARSGRKQAGVPEKEFIQFNVSTSPQLQEILTSNVAIVSKQIRSTDLIFIDELLPGGNVVSSTGFDAEPVYSRQIDVAAERERLTKDLARFNKGLEAADRQLSNEGFIARAPAHIVEGLRKQHAETLALKQKAEAALAALPSNP